MLVELQHIAGDAGIIVDKYMRAAYAIGIYDGLSPSDMDDLAGYAILSFCRRSYGDCGLIVSDQYVWRDARRDLQRLQGCGITSDGLSDDITTDNRLTM